MCTHGISRIGAEGQDRRLPRVEDRGAGVDAEHAHVGDRDRAAGHVRRRRLPLAGGGGQVGQGPGQLGERHPAGVLDVRDDQPARRGRGDAEVHVVLDHDLLGRLVPAAVDHRVPADGEQQRPRDEQQRADLDAGQLGPQRQPLAQLHHAGHVDGEELRDVRRGEGAGHHRRGGVLADALDRDPLLATRRTFGAEMAAWELDSRRGGAAVGGGVDVGAGDDPAVAGAGDAS